MPASNIKKTDKQAKEIKDKIINYIKNEGYYISRLFKEKNIGIHFDTFYEWLKNDSAFSESYARACEIRADLKFESLEELADSATPEDYNAIRLKVDTKKWILSKMNAVKYGDKQTLEHKGTAPISISIQQYGTHQLKTVEPDIEEIEHK
jgi:hypothetical protein